MARLGNEINNFVKTFLQSYKLFEKDDASEARADYYRARTAALKNQSAGLSDAEFKARLAGGSSGGSSGAAGASRALGREDVAAAARARMDYLVNERKIEPKVAAAMVGNDYQESGFNPTIIGDKGNSFGSFQFNKNGERPFFDKWIEKTGRDPNDWRSHYDHVLDELQNGRHKGVYQSMLKSPDERSASLVFSRGYERPHVDHANEPAREANSARFLSDYTTYKQSRAADEKRYQQGAVEAKPLPADKPAQEKPAEPAIPAPTYTNRPPSMLAPGAQRMSENGAIPTEQVAEAPAEAIPTEQVVELPPDALGLGEGLSVFAAEGGMIEQPGSAGAAEASLEEAVSAAMRGVQSMYGLGQERAALPGSDPQEQENLQAFATNADAASPEDMNALLQAVNPDGALPAGLANAKAIQSIYSFYTGKGDARAAETAAAGVLQATRARSMKLGALAGAALEKGDFAGAGKALIAAYDQVPDGRMVEGDVDQRGVGVAVIKDARSGKPVQQMQITPEVMKAAVERIASGSDFYPHLASTVGAAQTSTTAFAEGGLVEDEDEDDGTPAAALPAEPTAEADLPAEDAQEVQGALPSGGPRLVDTAGMSAEQRKIADTINRQRVQEYRDAAREKYKREAADKREAGRQAAAAARDERVNARADKREQYRQESENRRELVRQAGEDRKEQRSRNSGMTDEEMRSTVEGAAGGIRPALEAYIGSARSVEPTGRAVPSAVPAIPTMQMPAAVNAPRRGDEVAAVGGALDREFAASPGKRAEMIAARQRFADAQQEPGMAALDLGVRAGAKNRKSARGDLDEIDAHLQDKENGYWTSLVKGARKYVGGDAKPTEEMGVQTWARRIADYNRDLTPKTAAQMVKMLTAVQTRPNGEPIADPNWSVRFDPKTNTAKVDLDGGMFSVNVDRDTLRQIALMRQRRIHETMVERGNAADVVQRAEQAKRANAEARADAEKRRGADWRAMDRRRRGLLDLNPETPNP